MGEGRSGYKSTARGLLVVLELFRSWTVVVDPWTYTRDKINTHSEMSTSKPGEIGMRLVDCINVSILVTMLEFCTRSPLGETGQVYKGSVLFLTTAHASVISVKTSWVLFGTKCICDLYFNFFMSEKTTLATATTLNSPGPSRPPPPSPKIPLSWGHVCLTPLLPGHTVNEKEYGNLWIIKIESERYSHAAQLCWAVPSTLHG